MSGFPMIIECPHCENESLVVSPIEKLERIHPRYQSYNVIGQYCECKNSRGLVLVHMYIGLAGFCEAVYEYLDSGFSQAPVADGIYGRF
jgi:transcription elongation factor Elf1